MNTTNTIGLPIVNKAERLTTELDSALESGTATVQQVVEWSNAVKGISYSSDRMLNLTYKLGRDRALSVAVINHALS